MKISASVTQLGWLLLFVCLIAGCETVSSPNSADDARKWQGIWKLVSSTYDGEPQTADMEWIVDGNRYAISLNHQSHEDPYTFKLDASRKQIDVTHHETPAGTFGGSLKGIYEVSGNSLTVCYDLTGQRYPESLRPSTDRDRFCINLSESDRQLSWFSILARGLPV
jgi:uncharacterized protein (TIGR03067 family)